MLTESELINGTANASDDIDGVDNIIDNIYNEITKSRMKAVRFFGEGKSEDAIELRTRADEMGKELDRLIKQHLNYKKFLESKNKGKDGKVVPIGVHQDVKNQKSSNGQIVQEIPKH
jgi:hypothetical protein